MHWWENVSIVDVVYIIFFSLIINWMISLSIVTQVASDKSIRVRSALICALCGIVLGFIIHLI